MDERLSPRTRWWLGVAALWPLVYVVVFLVIPRTRSFMAREGWRALANGIEGAEALAVVLQMVTIVFAGGLTLFFFAHAVMSKRVPEPQRLPWALLLVLAGPLSMPVYWWAYVRPRLGEGS